MPDRMIVPDRTARTLLALAVVLSEEEGGLLPGIVCSQFIQCGKPNCRCRKGMPHGPYFYRIWRDGRTVKKVYVRAQDVARVRGQCDRYRVLDEELRALRARRLTYTARLWTQIRRSRRLREEPPK